MLNQVEEQRLQACIATVKEQLAGRFDDGLTLETQLWLALKLEEINSAYRKRYEEGRSVNQDKLIIKQAKDLLMSRYKLNEYAAHKFIQKAAMDGCITKFQAAKKIVDLETRP